MGQPSRAIYVLPESRGPITLHTSIEPSAATPRAIACWLGDDTNWLSNDPGAFAWPEPGIAHELPPALWSGWLTEDDDSGSGGSATPSPRTWMGAARGPLEARLIEARRRGLAVTIRPHALHAISDAPGVLDLLRRHDHAGVLLDPLVMLPVAWLATLPPGARSDRAEDHVRKLLADLAALPAVVGIVIAPPRGAEDPDSQAELALSLAIELAPPTLPLVFEAGARGAELASRAMA